MWKLAHGAFDPETSMTESFPGIPDSTDIDPPALGPVESTTLPNGVRVSSQDIGGPISFVGLFVAAGSRHETPFSSGVSHLLEHLAFKGSVHRSKYRMIRDMERTGALFTATAARETIAYSAEGLREQVPDMVSIVCESAVTPAVAVSDNSPEWDEAVAEIQIQTGIMEEELKRFSEDAPGNVTEAIHAAAFHGNTLGKSIPYLFLFVRNRGARVFRTSRSSLLGCITQAFSEIVAPRTLTTCTCRYSTRAFEMLPHFTTALL